MTPDHQRDILDRAIEWCDTSDSEAARCTNPELARELAALRDALFPAAAAVSDPAEATFHCRTCDYVFRASDAPIVNGKREFPCCKKLQELR